MALSNPAAQKLRKTERGMQRKPSRVGLSDYGGDCGKMAETSTFLWDTVPPSSVCLQCHTRQDFPFQQPCTWTACVPWTSHQ